jgi:hypothetical protein
MANSDVTHQFSRATNRRIANTLIILGMLLWIWTPYSYWKKLQFANGSANAVAQVIGHEGAPVIVFHDRSGRAITTTLTGWRPSKLGRGQQVEIAYSPEHPEQVELKSHLWTGQWISAVLATILCIIGWLMRKGIIVAGPLRQSRVRAGF